MDAAVAFDVVHESDEEPPCVIETGRAVRVQVGAGSGITVTVAVHVVVPPGPVAVPVYVVVAPGETDVEPPPTGETKPIAGSIEKVVAVGVAHDRVEEPPELIEVRDASRVQVGADGGGMTSAASQVTVPPVPVAVIV